MQEHANHEAGTDEEEHSMGGDGEDIGSVKTASECSDGESDKKGTSWSKKDEAPAAVPRPKGLVGFVTCRPHGCAHRVPGLKITS